MIVGEEAGAADGTDGVQLDVVPRTQTTVSWALYKNKIESPNLQKQDRVIYSTKTR